MDIRNYFSSSSQKKLVNEDSKGKKRKHIIESDEEDPLPSKTNSKAKKRLSSSESEDEIFVIKSKSKSSEVKRRTPKQEKKDGSLSKGTPSSKSEIKRNLQNNKEKLPEEKLKSVSVTDFFGSSPVFQSKKSASKKNKICELSDEAKFEATLKQLDESEEVIQVSHSPPEIKEVNENSPPNKMKENRKGLASKLSAKMKSKSVESDKRTSPMKRPDVQCKEITPKKQKIEMNESKDKKVKDSTVESKLLSDKKEKYSSPKTKLSRDDKKASEHVTTPNSSKKSTPYKTDIKEKHSPTKKTPKSPSKSAPMKAKEEDEILMNTPDEQKTQRSLAYRKYLQRTGPKNPGGKPLPEGSVNCLSGLTFVLTGVLETIDREETADLVKKCGGKVTTSVSKNTSYLVVGEDAGQSKITKAEKLNTKLLDEDQLFELINSSRDKTEGSATSPLSKANSEEPAKGKSKENVKVKSEDTVKPKSEEFLRSSSNSADSAFGSCSIPSPSFSKMSQLSFSDSQSTQKTESVSSQDLVSRSGESLMWVDKYKPASLKNIIGQQGDQSNAKKLLNWLRNWSVNQSGQNKLVKPSPWAKDNTGAYFKAALLSGPPGVGKTTTATLVCKELGFDAVEMNASDARSKKCLTEHVAELLRNQSLSGFVSGGAAATTRNHVLVMDEVDGMSGNEDRGGVQELITLIKSSKVPVICLCNDRNHPKIRSLSNYCFDLRFQKPRIEQIKGAMLSICYREGIKIKPESLNQMIAGSNQDVRQVLHHLSMWSADKKTLDADMVKKDSEMSHKEFKMGPWDVCTKVFSESAHKGMSIHDKVSLFFHDYSIAPLFVQENYLKASPHCARGDRKKLLKQMAKTAEVLADSDIIDKSIRRENAWSLLPTQALFSSVLPGQYMEGHLSAQVEFPKWLGNNSRKNKIDRLSQELQLHTRLQVSGTKLDIIMDYAVPLRDAVVRPLSKFGSEGVKDAVGTMVNYNLLRDDLDALLELTLWPGMKDPMTNVESKVKAAFTRNFNKESHLSPFSSASSAVSKKRGGGQSDLVEDDQEEEDEEDEEDIKKDNMIKVGKLSQRSSGSSSKSSSEDAAKPSKGKGSNTKQGKRSTKK